VAIISSRYSILDLRFVLSSSKAVMRLRISSEGSTLPIKSVTYDTVAYDSNSDLHANAVQVSLGISLGPVEGLFEGIDDGSKGFSDGDSEGNEVGSLDGIFEGIEDGSNGFADGVFVGF